VIVGMDVAKASLDVAVRPSGEQSHVDNDAAGIAEAVAWLHSIGPHVIVAEATGGSEAPLVAEWGLAALPVVVVNPRQLRDARSRHRALGEDRSAGCAGVGPLR
jgi:transposase